MTWERVSQALRQPMRKPMPPCTVSLQHLRSSGRSLLHLALAPDLAGWLAWRAGDRIGLEAGTEGNAGLLRFFRARDAADGRTLRLFGRGRSLFVSLAPPADLMGLRGDCVAPEHVASSGALLVSVPWTLDGPAAPRLNGHVAGLAGQVAA